MEFLKEELNVLNPGLASTQVPTIAVTPLGHKP